MAVYDARKLTKLAGNVRDWDSKINSAAANALNRAATKARNDSVSEIFNRTTLSVAGRASPSNLRSIVQGVNRATLLSRFDYIKTSAGVKVKVNNRGGFKLIKDSFVVTNLRGSTSTGIAMSNVRAAAYYADAAIGGGSQAVKRKAIKLAIKAKTKPGGIHVLHSRSITQLFESVKVDVSPSVQLFLERTFLDNLGR